MLFSLSFWNGFFTLPTTAQPSLSFLYLSGNRTPISQPAAKRLTSAPSHPDIFW